MHLDTPRRLTPPLAAAVVALSLAAGPVAAQDASPGAAASPDATPAASPGVTIEECVEPEATAEPVAEAPLSMPEDFRIALFDGVWQGIRDYYWDPQTSGLDWEAVGDEYAPLVLQTDDAYDVYELLSEMVELLDDPYTGFFAPEDLSDAGAIDPSYGGIGALLDTSAAGEDSDGLRILYVFEGGSAKDAGIGARDRIVAVEGDSCARIAEIRGPAGTEVTLTVVSPGEAPRQITLERRQIEPMLLPEVHRLEADPAIGYLRVLALSGAETIEAIEQGLTRLAREPLEGLILDLRASNQGAPAVTIATLGHFVSGEVGEYHSRVGDEPIEVEPSDLADEYAGVPLVVLVDDETEADAEQLAAILQDQGRATIVGMPTSGQTHGATTIDFPEGSLLQIVTFGFRLPDGRTLEGEGVTPDVVVEADWLDYPESEDPFVAAASDVLAEARAPASPEASPAAEGTPAAELTPAAEASPAVEASPAG